jgi:flagellum-specific peptidoglycan hydrolase FlgJ
MRTLILIFIIAAFAQCRGCRCANYSDDSEFDMFRIFPTAWESYREHSILLSGTRYKHLKGKCKNDFVCWAKGLQSSGYATNKKYSVALISIIKKYSLQKLDN